MDYHDYTTPAAVFLHPHCEHDARDGHNTLSKVRSAVTSMWVRVSSFVISDGCPEAAAKHNGVFQSISFKSFVEAAYDSGYVLIKVTIDLTTLLSCHCSQ